MKKNSYNATVFLASALVLISSLQAVNAIAQDRNNATPKLIIGIAVDQLRTDYIHNLEHKLGNKGLKRLMNGGLVYENVVFDLDNPDVTAALAVLATGSYPLDNGISSANVYNQQMLRSQSIFFDKDYIGNSTSSNYSPKALIGTCIADELKLASNNASRVYSIAPDAENAIVTAGHIANCALWLDNKTGKWASTTFYKDFPQLVIQQNFDNALFADVQKVKWTPLSAADYHQVLLPYNEESKSAFSHTFTQKRTPVYQWVKTSPLINDAITQLSKRFIHDARLGQNGTTDMLQLTFYAGTFMGEDVSSYADELQDIYLRLDNNLSELLQTVEQNVGIENAIIYLTSTGASTANCPIIEGFETGEFNTARCSALLNSYLISQFGQGNWVDAFNDWQIYLNHQTIDNKALSLKQVQSSAADFVSMFSGVSDVFTSHQILHEDYPARVERIRNGYNRRYGGDLYVKLQPGWTMKADDASAPRPPARLDIAPGPAIIYAPGRVSPKHYTTPVDASAIAPTVAKCIRIRAPSGCRQMPLNM